MLYFDPWDRFKNFLCFTFDFHKGQKFFDAVRNVGRDSDQSNFDYKNFKLPIKLTYNSNDIVFWDHYGATNVCLILQKG